MRGKVRSYSCSDTLYVVTGDFISVPETSTTDGVGSSVPVPTNYFKVLLRTKSGSTNKKVQDCSPNELISIGFWVEQKAMEILYRKSICTTVADIEEKTGFTFFPKVDSSVKQQMDLAQWGNKMRYKLMKKQLFCTIFFVLLISVCFGQKPYKVVFYNLENFFDTINDPEVKDDEFTPEGPKKWNTAKYNKKLGNIERVLFGMAAIDKEYPIVIGVSEVENQNVLEDIVATPKAGTG